MEDTTRTDDGADEVVLNDDQLEDVAGGAAWSPDQKSAASEPSDLWSSIDDSGRPNF